MIDVIILFTEPFLTQDEFDELLQWITPEKKERIKRFHSIQDANNALLADIISRIEICRVTGLKNNQLEFSTNTYGKPFLMNDSRIHHNISHAGK